jgi:hypothetical protein
MMSDLTKIPTEEVLQDRQDTLDEIAMCQTAIRLHYNRVDGVPFRDMLRVCCALLETINGVLAERGIEVNV